MPTNPFPDVPFRGMVREFFAEKVRITAACRLTHPEILTDANISVLKRAWEHDAEALTIILDSYVLAMPKEMIVVHERWPADWWQAVRERWFPRWWLKRWPVRYKSIDIEKKIFGRVCPHVRVPDRKTHLEWMAVDVDNGG